LNHYKDAFLQVISFVESLEKDYGVRYYLVGGILVNVYSDFRTTRDIDLALDLYRSDLNIKELIQLLEKNNFNPIQDWETTRVLAKENELIQFLDKTETVRYDIHIVSKNPTKKYKKIGQIALERRTRKEIFNIECWALSKEDFILSKLVFGGWQDYTDALGCWMRFKKDLTISYLKRMSKNLEIKEEFNLLRSGIRDPDEFFEKLHKF
jgi:hypothetical protein